MSAKQDKKQRRMARKATRELLAESAQRAAEAVTVGRMLQVMKGQTFRRRLAVAWEIVRGGE